MLTAHQIERAERRLGLDRHQRRAPATAPESPGTVVGRIQMVKRENPITGEMEWLRLHPDNVAGHLRCPTHPSIYWASGPCVLCQERKLRESREAADLQDGEH